MTVALRNCLLEKNKVHEQRITQDQLTGIQVTCSSGHHGIPKYYFKLNNHIHVMYAARLY